VLVTGEALIDGRGQALRNGEGLDKLRVVVADDSPLIRALIADSFSYLTGVKIVGMAEDGLQAIKMVAELKPDIVVLDISMPHKNGIEVLKHIRSEDASILIVMFTADPSMVLREACIDAGANHYLEKCQIDELLSICRGELLGG
jgi:DNA-binding NarL/FixJ family response regulator